MGILRSIVMILKESKQEKNQCLECIFINLLHDILCTHFILEEVKMYTHHLNEFNKLS